LIFFASQSFPSSEALSATTANSSGFKAPFTLSEGLHRTLHYEFIDTEKDEVVFVSE
jgi:hypothetical protein